MNKEIIKRGILVLSLGFALIFSLANRHTTNADSLSNPPTVNEPAVWAAMIHQVNAAQTPAPNQAATNQTPEPTAEQKYKNIQILKGLPASQLPPLMHLFTA